MNADLIQTYFLSMDKGFMVAAFFAGIAVCALFVLIIEAFSKTKPVNVGTFHPTTPYERREMPKPKTAAEIKKALQKLQPRKKKK